MSKQRKTLKIVSLVLLAWGIIQVLLLISRLIGGVAVFSDGAKLLCYVINAIAAFTVGWAGVQAANRPSQSASLIKISAIIMLILAAFVAVWAIFFRDDLDFITAPVLLALVAITFIGIVASHVFARKVRAAAER